MLQLNHAVTRLCVSRARPGAARAWAMAGAWALVLLMQCVGLLHGYEHPRHGPAPAADAQARAAHGLAGLFGSHEGDSDACRLFDQLAHADTLPAAPCVAAAAVLSDGAAPTPASGHHAAQAAGYLARGPPQHA